MEKSIQQSRDWGRSFQTRPSEMAGGNFLCEQFKLAILSSHWSPTSYVTLRGAVSPHTFFFSFNSQPPAIRRLIHLNSSSVLAFVVIKRFWVWNLYCPKLLDGFQIGLSLQWHQFIVQNITRRVILLPVSTNVTTTFRFSSISGSFYTKDSSTTSSVKIHSSSLPFYLITVSKEIDGSPLSDADEGHYHCPSVP